MPNKTFFNLPQEKQDHIIQQSISVFATGTYNEITIAALIKGAGIPRSSFYDYFEDKQDLYKHILDYIGQKKAHYFEASRPEDDFFDELKRLLLASAKFVTFEPELHAIANNFLADPVLINALYGTTQVDARDAFKAMLQKGIKLGNLRQDIDLDFTAKILTILSMGLMVDGASEKDKPIEDIITEMAYKMTEFVQMGIGKASNNA